MTSTNTTTERFMIHNYFNFPIIVDTTNGYVNATQLCDHISKVSGKGRPFFNFCRTNDWKQTVKAYKRLNNQEVEVILSKGVRNDLKGHYIHPHLVHHVAHWASIEYSITVARVMEAIHERNQIVGHDTTNEIIAELTEQNKKLKQELIDRGVEVGALTMRAVPENFKDAYMILINKEGDNYRVTKRISSSLNKKPIRELANTAIIKRLNVPIGLSFVKDMVSDLGLTYKKSHIISPTDDQLKQIEDYISKIPEQN